MMTKIKRGMKTAPWALLLPWILPVAATLVACVSFNAVVFRSEQTATDLVDGARQVWVEYYRNQTNGASAARLAELNKMAGDARQAGTNFANSLLLLESARQSYQTNAAGSNKVALQIALDMVNANASNFVAGVKILTGH